jgi:hypothetical protein
MSLFLDENPPSKTIVEGRGGVLSLNRIEYLFLFHHLKI